MGHQAECIEHQLSVSVLALPRLFRLLLLECNRLRLERLYTGEVGDDFQQQLIWQLIEPSRGSHRVTRQEGL